MTGELSLFGVLVPTILVLAMVAFVISLFLARWMATLGLYRWFHNRPLVDLAMFIILLALLCWAAGAKVTS